MKIFAFKECGISVLKIDRIMVGLALGIERALDKLAGGDNLKE